MVNGARCKPQVPSNAWRLGVGLSILMFGVLAGGQTPSASEYEVKAAYLYNFAKSAVWPEESLSASSPLTIGVAGGDDEFIDTLQKTIAGKTVASHSIAVRRTLTVAEMDFCQMVFFRASLGHKRTQAAINALASANILLVGEDEDFLRRGGMINLSLKNGRVRFEVNQPSLAMTKIRISPELLALAAVGGEREAAVDTPAETRQLKVGPLPEYPELAKKMNLQGAVQVEAIVRRDGSVKEVRVIGGHPLLAEALVKAVKEWRYAPAAEESHVVVWFTFGK